VLLGGEGVEFGLAFFTEQAGELGESDRLFGRVDDSFDLGFKTHGCRVECINPAPMEEDVKWCKKRDLAGDLIEE